LGYQRYYSTAKYVLMIVAVLFLFLAGNRYMLSQQSVDKGVDSYWVLHEAGTSVPDDSALWNQGQRVDAGMTKQQLDFKLVIDEFSIAQYITVAPAYLDTVVVEFFDQHGNTINIQIKGDKERRQATAYHYDVGRLVFETPSDAVSSRIKIRSTQTVAVSLSFLSGDMLVRQGAFNLIMISMVLFIIISSVMLSLIAGVRLKQPFFFAFAIHQFVWVAVLAALSNLVPSFWPHLSQLNGTVLGALSITLVMTGAVFHWSVLRDMIAAKWLDLAIGTVVLITFFNLTTYFFADQNIAIVSSNITTAVLAVGLISFIPRKSPKDKIQGFIFKKIRVLYSFLMLSVALGALSRLGLGQHSQAYFYVYALSSLMILALILLFRATISHRRELNVANASLRLARFNDQLNMDLAEQSALLSMLSHEIKTPLTTLHFCVSGAPQEGLIHKQLAHIQHVVDKVEMMGSIDADFVSHEQVYIIELVRNQWQKPQSFSVDDRRLNLMSRGDLGLVGNKLALEVIINDLLNNARKYATGGRVQVNIIAQGGYIYLRCKNHCEKLTSSSISALTDKYYRASNVGGIRGTGLGLWIVNNLCIANNYSLHFQLKGNVFIATVGIKK
jgi:signal transduction histidine kinase